MASTTSNAAAATVTVEQVRRRPRAIAVLLGHMGQERKDLDRYATRLYHSQHCSTVSATAPFMVYATHDAATLSEYAVVVIRETARLIRYGEWSEMGFGRIPVLVHVLGNGGAQLLEEMERRIREVVSNEELEDMKTCEALPFYTKHRQRDHRGLALRQNGPHKMAVGSTGSSTRSLTNLTVNTESESDGGSIDQYDPAQDSNDKSDEQQQPQRRRQSGFGWFSRLRTSPKSDSAAQKEKENKQQQQEQKQREEQKQKQKKQQQKQEEQQQQQQKEEQKERQLANLSNFPNSQLTRLGQSLSLSPANKQQHGQAQSHQSQNQQQRQLERQRSRRKRKAPAVQRIDWERQHTSTTIPVYNTDEEAYCRDLHLFASHLAMGSIVFDSAPYVPSFAAEIEGAVACLQERNCSDTNKNNTSHSNSNSDKEKTNLRVVMAQSAIASTQSLHGIGYYTTLGQYKSTANGATEPGRPEQFWRNMQDLRLTQRMAFVYSHTDTVCDGHSVQRLSRLYQARHCRVLQCVLTGTRHLQHLQKEPERYRELIERVLDSLVGSGKVVVEQNEDGGNEQGGWWSDDDDD